MRTFVHPTVDQVTSQAILHALSDPERAKIYAEIAGLGCIQGCATLADTGERVIPKSSLSQHFRVLREAGLIRSERHGVEMRNYARCGEIDGRFPGLLAAIMRAYAEDSGPQFAEAGAVIDKHRR